MGNSSSTENSGKTGTVVVSTGEVRDIQSRLTSPKNAEPGRLLEGSEEDHYISVEKQELSDDDFTESTDTVKSIRTGFLKELDGPPITFILELNCENKEGKKIKELKVPEDILSQSVYKLKLCIEDQHNIPACCQTLSCAGNTLEDEELVCHYYVRDGDCIRVKFPGTVEVGAILNNVDDLNNVLFQLRSWETNLKRGTLPEDMLLKIHRENIYGSVNSLSLFYESNGIKENRTTRLFLADCGAFVVLRKLHEELLKHQVSHLPVELILMESRILSFYWQLTADDVLFQYICKSRVLYNISRSFMRMKIDKILGVKLPNSMMVERDWRRNNITREVVFKAMGGLCNFAEKPGFDVKIASNKYIMDQLLALVCCTRVNFFYRVVTMGGIFSLSFRYFAVTSVAIVFSTSPHLIRDGDKKKMADIFKLFLKDSDPLDIRDKEVNFGFLWLSVLSYMKLAYHPFQLASQSCPISEEEVLNRYCVQCGIFSLSNVLQSEGARDTLIQEGLLDYLVCMPWLYPHDLIEKKKARELVQFMSRHTQLQPPSLISLTKAKLASMYFGLDKVLSSDVHQLFDEVFTK